MSTTTAPSAGSAVLSAAPSADIATIPSAVPTSLSPARVRHPMAERRTLEEEEDADVIEHEDEDDVEPSADAVESLEGETTPQPGPPRA